MKYWLIIASLVVQGALAEEPAKTGEADGGKPALTVDQILAETLTAEDYGDIERCIDLNRISSTTVLDRQHVAFRMSRQKIFIAKLIGPCRSLEREDVLALRATGNRLCRLDTVYSVDRASGIAGPHCAIDSFQQVTAEQYTFLRKELKKNR